MHIFQEQNKKLIKLMPCEHIFYAAGGEVLH